MPPTTEILHCKLNIFLVIDYFRTGQSELTFNSNGTQTILISIIDDIEDQPPESFSISLVKPVPAGTVTISPDTITITIIDNDEPPTGQYVYLVPLALSLGTSLH